MSYMTTHFLPTCDGRLADVAPTLFALLDLPKPAEMTGRSLILAARDAQDGAPAARAVAE